MAWALWVGRVEILQATLATIKSFYGQAYILARSWFQMLGTKRRPFWCDDNKNQNSNNNDYDDNVIKNNSDHDDDDENNNDNHSNNDYNNNNNNSYLFVLTYFFSPSKNI